MRIVQFIVFALALTCTPLFAATYYIDYTTGLDSNNGTTKTTPWKHVPAMEPFSGKYSHTDGDRFILKGGVTWPAAALPLYITIGGAAGNLDYYGVDPTWHSGDTWSRPVFDGEGIPFTNHGGNRGNVIYIDGSGSGSIQLDNIEIKNFVWNNPVTTSISDGFAVYLSSTNDILVSNLYVHDWVIKTTADGKMGGLGANNSSNTTARDCKIEAPTYIDPQYVTNKSGFSSGCGMMNFSVVDSCEIIRVSQGLWNPAVAKNCIIRDGGDSYLAAAHENGIWLQNGAQFYNNRVYNLRGGVGMYALPGWGSRSPRIMKIYNNVFFNTPQINLTSQANPDTTNEIWFVNNVVKQRSYCIQVGTEKAGAAFGKLVIQNNVFISESKYTSPSIVIKILDANDLGADCKNTNNIVYTEAEAAAAGLREDNFFAPRTQAITALQDKGVSHSEITRTDFNGVARPQGGAWDIGPYEFPSSPQGLRVVD